MQVKSADDAPSPRRGSVGSRSWCWSRDWPVGDCWGGGPVGPTTNIATFPTSVSQAAPPGGSELIRGIVYDTAPGLSTARGRGPRRTAGGHVDDLQHPEGRFSLVGTFDDATRFRATREGHVAATGTLRPCRGCNPGRWLIFNLDVLAPSREPRGRLHPDLRCQQRMRRLSRPRSTRERTRPRSRTGRPRTVLPPRSLSRGSADRVPGTICVGSGPVPRDPRRLATTSHSGSPTSTAARASSSTAPNQHLPRAEQGWGELPWGRPSPSSPSPFVRSRSTTAP